MSRQVRHDRNADAGSVPCVPMQVRSRVLVRTSPTTTEECRAAGSALSCGPVNSGSSTAHCSPVGSPRDTNQEHRMTKIHFRNTPLVYPARHHVPGVDAEVDFAEVWIDLAAERVKCFLLVFRLAYPGRLVHRVSQPCGRQAFLEGHVHALTVLSGVPAGQVRCGGPTPHQSERRDEVIRPGSGARRNLPDEPRASPSLRADDRSPYVSANPRQIAGPTPEGAEPAASSDTSHALRPPQGRRSC